MSLLFADIYEAIRCLRIQKGVCEKDILNYVQDKVGGCMSVKNVLKTIRTLKKLVDDGVLKQNGKRYTFNKDGPKCDDDDDDDDECEDEDKPEECKIPDECDEGNDDDDDDDDEKCEDDDDDDDDDDDEEEEDDDDDDDDDDEECEEENEDDECNENSPTPDDECDATEEQPEVKKDAAAAMETAPKKISIQNATENGSKTSKTGDARPTPSEKVSGKNTTSLGSRKNVIDQNGGEMNKGGENIAFCVRDFMDSLYRPTSKSKEKEKHQKLEIFPQENMDSMQRCESSKNKKQKFSKKKGGIQQCSFRSRSPIKGGEADMFFSLKRDRMDDLRTISSILLQEPTDVDMEVDVEQEKDVGTDVDAFRHPSPIGVPSPNTPSLQVTSTHEIRVPQPTAELNNEYALKKNIQEFPELDNLNDNQMNWHPFEGRDKLLDSYKRDASIEDERNDEENASLCSVCDKKKITS